MENSPGLFFRGRAGSVIFVSAVGDKEMNRYIYSLKTESMGQNDWHRIVERPSRKESMTAAVVELLQQEPYLDRLMDMALGNDAEAFRASRCVAIAYERERSLFLSYKNRFVADFGRVSHHGVRRVYGRLMQSMLERGEYCPTRDSAEQLAEVVCAWSIEPGVKVANLLWTFSILSQLSRQVEWAGDMLHQLVVMNDVDRSPGMRALLRRIRKSFKIA